METIYQGTLDDLSFLLELEKSFKEDRRFTKEQLKRSLTSKAQSVYIIKKDNVKAGSIIIFKYKTSIRIYSIAVTIEHRKHGLGKKLLQFVFNEAKRNGKIKITLEVDVNETKLIKWYESFGFNAKSVISDYYKTNQSAIKMELLLEDPSRKIKNLLVYNDYYKWLEEIKNIDIISAEEFINNNKFKRSEYRVFNICNNYDYQKIGYFVSLFSQARDQRVFPNVVTIEDILDQAILDSISEEIEEVVYKTFKNEKEKEKEIVIDVLWGKTNKEKFKVFSKTFI